MHLYAYALCLLIAVKRPADNYAYLCVLKQIINLSNNNTLPIFSHQWHDVVWWDCREHDGQAHQARDQRDRQLEEPQWGKQTEAAWQIECEQAYTREEELCGHQPD